MIQLFEQSIRFWFWFGIFFQFSLPLFWPIHSYINQIIDLYCLSTIWSHFSIICSFFFVHSVYWSDPISSIWNQTKRPLCLFDDDGQLFKSYRFGILLNHFEDIIEFSSFFLLDDFFWILLFIVDLIDHSLYNFFCHYITYQYQYDVYIRYNTLT